MEGLLGHFRSSNDTWRAGLLQDCWLLMYSCINRRSWGERPAWQIARLSLTVPREYSIMDAPPGVSTRNLAAAAEAAEAASQGPPFAGTASIPPPVVPLSLVQPVELWQVFLRCTK